MLKVSRQTVLHNIAALRQNMKQGAFLCPMRRGKAVLMQKVCMPDHMIDEVPVAYIVLEAMVDSRIQKSAQLSNSV